MLTKYESLRAQLKICESELSMVKGDSPAAIKQREKLELNILALEEMSSEMENTAKDILQELHGD